MTRIQKQYMGLDYQRRNIGTAGWQRYIGLVMQVAERQGRHVEYLDEGTLLRRLTLRVAAENAVLLKYG